MLVHVQLMETVLRGEVPQQPQTCHDEVYEILRTCCDVEPDKRPKPQLIIRNIRSFITQGSPAHSSSVA